MFAAVRGFFAKADYSVNLIWVLVVLAIIALVVFIFTRWGRRG